MLAALFSTSMVSAQTEGPMLYLKNNDEGIVRGASYDSSFLFLNQFNRQSCLDDETVLFNIDIRGTQAMVQGFHIEAWVGSACDDKANRISDQCTLIGQVGTFVEQVELRVRDLVRSSATSEADPCGSDFETPRDGTVYFMLLDTDNAPPPGLAVVKWAYRYDLVAPPAPTTVQASPAPGGLHLTWERPNAPIDLRRNVFLCDPPPQGDPSGALGPNDFCESPVLERGQELTLDQIVSLECGEIEGGATSADVVPLTTGVNYAVAIVALDTYYNFSLLSDTACDVPDPPQPGARTVITERGCALGGRADGALAPLIMAVGITEVARRRRRARLGRRTLASAAARD